MIKNLRILITGASGFIGQHLVRALYKTNTVFPVNNVNEIQHWDYDIIFHLGGNTDTRKTYAPEHIINVLDFSLICQIANRGTPLVYASSASVYGNQESPLSTVTSEVSPLNPYAISKALIEKYASFCPNFSKIGLRYFNVYGPGEQHKVGYNSMVYQIMKAVKSKSPVKLFASGQQERDFVYIDDVIDYTLKAGELVLNKNFNTVYNVGSGKSVSFNKVCEVVAKETGNVVDIEYIKQKYEFFQTKTQAEMDITNFVFKMSPKFDIKAGVSKFNKNWPVN